MRDVKRGPKPSGELPGTGSGVGGVAAVAVTAVVAGTAARAAARRGHPPQS